MVSTETHNLSICSRPYFDYRLNYSLGRFWKYEHVVSVWKENAAKQAWCRLYKFSSIKSEQASPKLIYAWVWWNAKDKECTNYFPQTERNKRTPSLIFLQICQYVWQLPWEKIVFTILIFALFLWNKKRKLFTYGEYKLAANNMFKTKKTNFFKRAKLASKTLKENCSKKKNIVYSQIWTMSILSSISVLDTIFFDNMFEYYCTGQLLSGVYSGIKEQVLFKLFSFYSGFLKAFVRKYQFDRAHEQWVN